MEQEVKLTVKEQRFVEEYVKDFNATQAAIRAGYSKNTARQIGYENLTKPHIKAEIQKLLTDLSLGKEETKKLITDIATANPSNYFKKVKVEKSKRIKKGLQQLIDEVRAQIEFEDEFAMQANLQKKELERHEKDQESRRRQIIRYKIELKKNPKAFRIVSGPTELVDDVELDLVALVEDKEGGRIKSIKNGKYGVEVDLLPADNALTNMARIHGLFVDKSIVDNQVTMVKPLIIDWGEDQEDAGTSSAE